MIARSVVRSAFLASSTRASSFSTSSLRSTKVAVLGAGGGIGQPLSLLLKLDPYVTSLSLYDIKGVSGVAADVQHVDTAGEVNGYISDQLDSALKGVEVVVIPAGVPRKPGTTSRDDLFNANAGIVRDLATAIGRVSPTAHILVISNPVNSTVPIIASVLEKAGVFNPRRLFGITTLDVVRASRFLGGIAGTNPATTPVTVVGGHSATTIVPLISQTPIASAAAPPGSDAWKALVHRIQCGSEEVVKAKGYSGSATLSMAYAAAKFTNSILRALNGEKGIITPTYVYSPLYKSEGVDFFSSNVELGTGGVEKIHGLGKISPEEEALIKTALPELKRNIERGRKFVAADSVQKLEGEKNSTVEEEALVAPQPKRNFKRAKWFVATA